MTSGLISKTNSSCTSAWRLPERGVAHRESAPCPPQSAPLHHTTSACEIATSFIFHCSTYLSTLACAIEQTCAAARGLKDRSADLKIQGRGSRKRSGVRRAGARSHGSMSLLLSGFVREGGLAEKLKRIHGRYFSQCMGVVHGPEALCREGGWSWEKRRRVRRAGKDGAV